MASRRSDSDSSASGQRSRYVVGIDLGTTNSAVTYVDSSQTPWQVKTLAIVQLVAPSQVEARDNLPSFHYQAAEGEFASDALRLPWSDDDPSHSVGYFARDHGAVVPGRLIGSAKSWMCHTGVDRTAALLPWHGAPDVERLSPVEVSGRYLSHIRDAWDAQFPSDPLAKQEIVLTLPASFDEVARELTVKAAARAGLPKVVLVEEPQAAFYAWVDNHRDDWQQHVTPGQKILVCDIGGGTSDFTLIRVRRDAEGKIQFHRVAVGDHLILGGDNLDLALAHHLEQRLCPDGRLEPRQWSVLVRSCRLVKETLLTAEGPQQFTVSIPGSGSKLIGGSLQVDVTREEVNQVLLDGFLPHVSLDEKPSIRQSGFQEFGLPYAPDAAITRYLAAFLTAHRDVALDDIELPQGDIELPQGVDTARPDIVLLNGGLFASDVLRQRLLDVLSSWFSSDDKQPWAPQLLDNDRLDLAVAHGAAYYGMVRRGEGVRINADLARTYYIGVAAENSSALCLVPAKTQPGEDVDLADRTFDLLISEPVEFPLYTSSTRLTDAAGELVAIDRSQMTPLPPIRTVLQTRKKSETGSVKVHLHARLSEIGTLDLGCREVDGRGSWRLQFDVRSATQTDVTAHETIGEAEGFVDDRIWHAGRTILHNTFSDTNFGDATFRNTTFRNTAKEKPQKLIKRLAEAFDSSRNAWPTSLLRRIWEELFELEQGRRISAAHEARWLNLLGFALRPGYGLAVDDWRVAETWRLVQGKLNYRTTMCLSESWILWRRIGAGLAAGQQQSLADPLLAPVRNLHRRMTTGKGRGDVTFSSQESVEVWRLLGSLELLNVSTKIELGKMLVDLLPKKKMQSVRPAITWALGRVGTRVPVHGPLNTVVPPHIAAEWLASLLKLHHDTPMDKLAVMQLARKTDDRYRDLPEASRNNALEWLTETDAPPHFAELLRSAGQLDTEEQGRVFGESLPKGLSIL